MYSQYPLLWIFSYSKGGFDRFREEIVWTFITNSFISIAYEFIFGLQEPRRRRGSEKSNDLSECAKKGIAGWEFDKNYFCYVFPLFLYFHVKFLLVILC